MTKRRAALPGLPGHGPRGVGIDGKPPQEGVPTEHLEAEKLVRDRLASRPKTSTGDVVPVRPKDFQGNPDDVVIEHDDGSTTVHHSWDKINPAVPTKVSAEGSPSKLRTEWIEAPHRWQEGGSARARPFVNEEGVYASPLTPMGAVPLDAPLPWQKAVPERMMVQGAPLHIDLAFQALDAHRVKLERDDGLPGRSMDKTDLLDFWACCLSDLPVEPPDDSPRIPLLPARLGFEAVNAPMARAMVADFDSAEGRTTAIVGGCLVGFWQSGQQVFVIGPHMRDMFEKTDLHNVDLNMLRFPYDAFYLHFPYPDRKIWGGDRTGYHDVLGMYIRRAMPYEPGWDMVICVCGGANEKSAFHGDDASSWFGLTFKTVEEAGGIEPYLNELLSGTGWVGESIQANGRVGPSQMTTLPGHINPSEIDTLKLATRVAINFMMYLNSPGSEVVVPLDVRERRARARKLREQINGIYSAPRNHKAKRRLVTKLNKLQDCSVRYVGERIEKTGRTVAGHWVRGHWHHYWVGKRSAPRLIVKWIQPYPKGDAHGDGRIYLAEDS